MNSNLVKSTHQENKIIIRVIRLNYTQRITKEIQYDNSKYFLYFSLKEGRLGLSLMKAGMSFHNFGPLYINECWNRVSLWEGTRKEYWLLVG